MTTPGGPRIVLDCDPGVDDMFAVFTALKYCEIAAITTVAGNVALAHTTANALGLVALTGATVPVYSGADRALHAPAPEDARHVHGETGLGGVTLPDHQLAVAGTDAAGALIELTSDGDTDLVAVGPLTNVALALQRDPDWASKVRRLVLMGGSTDTGNVTATAEFNVWADPEAAALVFASDLPVTMVGLNLTRQVQMGQAEIERLRAAGTDTAVFAADALEFYAGYSLREYGVPKTAMHDPCAVLELSHPQHFSREDMHVVVETDGSHTRGMTVCDRRPSATDPNTTVLVEADAAPLIDLIIDATTSPQ